MVDVVIISFAKNDEFKKVTESAIRSLQSSERSIDFRVVVVETNKKVSYDQFKNTETVHPDVPFGYHRYLNIGIARGRSEYVCICNNDLIFKPNWASTIISQMRRDRQLLSASPYSTIPHKTVYGLNPSNSLDYGYQIRRHISGWCIFQKREIYQKIGKLDERFEFWYADNDYGETIKRKGIKHALVRNSVVDHIESVTLTSKSEIEQTRLTRAQRKIFTDKWKINP
jgi:GT2 family glycosyltransferase